MCNGGLIWTCLSDTKELVLYEEYSPDKYPRYDNYNAIEVSKTTQIPKDYDGIMGFRFRSSINITQTNSRY